MNDPGLTRRQFVRTAGGSALALSALASAQETTESASEAPPPRKLRKAVKLGMVHGELTLLEKFRLLRNLGFDGVEVSSPGGLKHAEVRRAIDETGLVVHGVVCSEHWKSPLSHPEASVRQRCHDAIVTAIRDCQAFGGTTVLIVAGVVSKQVPYGDAYPRSRDEIARLLPVAEQHGVRLAIENVWNQFLLSPIEAARFVDELKSPWIGWYFDVGNVVNYGWPEHWIQALGRRILKVDVKEYSRSRRDNEGLWKGFDVKLLEGDCDWPAVMRALDEIGYEGWLTAEIGGGDAVWLKDVAERMDRIMRS